jgi:hypothetical protein
VATRAPDRDWQRLLGDRAALDTVIAASGGYLRDLLFLVREVVVRAERLPVPTPTLEAAIDEVRNGYLPLSEADARWLARVAATHSAALATGADVPRLARFLDTHLVLCYRNGREWYDVHPLLAGEVARLLASSAEQGG